MKKVPCFYYDCGSRRVHWCDPYTERGTQYVEVPDDYEGPAFCSFECAILAGRLKLKIETSSPNDPVV